MLTKIIIVVYASVISTVISFQPQLPSPIFVSTTPNHWKKFHSSLSVVTQSSKCLHLKSKLNNEDEIIVSSENKIESALQSPITFAIVSFLYWYLLVFGAAAEANGLPVPSFIPLVPGWPPSDQDLVPVIEDSIHFFYISDVLNYFSTTNGVDSGTGEGIGATTTIPPLRLAFFNTAEAWIFSFLPLLLTDKKRLPLPVVLGTWLGALGLTNAFLAPYMALRQLLYNLNRNNYSNVDDGSDEEYSDISSLGDKIFKVTFGSVASIVVGYAFVQTVITTATSPGDWGEFIELVRIDRTYFAFAIDLVLFSFFQFLLLNEVYDKGDTNDNKNIPFAGLITWLFK